MKTIFNFRNKLTFIFLLIAFIPLGLFALYVNFKVGEMMQDQIIKEDLKSVFVFLVFLLTILIVWLAYYFARKTTKPMYEIVKATEKVSQGDFDIVVEVSSKDEIGKLAEAFNKMVSQLREIVSLQKELKKIKALERVKTEFISVAAHQLRTPLAKIKWSLRLLMNGDFGAVNSEQKEALESGYESNEKMIKLINDFLDLSKVEDVNLGYDFKEESIERVAEEVVKSFMAQAKDKGVELILSKSEYPIPPIMMDSRKISMVFSNLIDNALSYTPKGGKIEVTLENKEDYVNVLVKDNGIGIPKEEVKRLFARFFRAKNAIRIKTEGTGLGLHIARSIVQIHGGDMRVESEEGKGSSFYFTIPFHSKEKVDKNIASFLKSL